MRKKKQSSTSEPQWVWKMSLEMRRLRWRVKLFDEQPLARLRKRIDGPNHALIFDRDPIPPDWPCELRVIDKDADRIAWRFQDSFGKWHGFTGQSPSSNKLMLANMAEEADGDFRDYILRVLHGASGWVYSRDPVAALHTRVRPIAHVCVDKDDICFGAQARWTDSILATSLERAGLWTPAEGIPGWMHPQLLEQELEDQKRFEQDLGTPDSQEF